MSDLIWLSQAQMRRIEPYFPLSHGVPRVDDRKVLSGIVFMIRNGLRWREPNVGFWRKADELTGACQFKTVRKRLMATNIRSQREPSNLQKHGLAAPIKAEGFNHLHINVRDLARSIRFYAEAFGLKVGFSVGNDLIFMVPEANGHSLALHQVGPDESVGMSGGIQHFGFKLDVNDHDRVLAQVEKAGGKLISRGKHGGQYPYTYVADPDGYIIEL